jgi:hypothetical protein
VETIVVASLITMTVVIIVTVVMIKAIVMEVAIRGEDMMMMIVPVDMMVIVLVIVMMIIGVMVIGVDGMIVSLLHMSTLPVRFATFMGIPLVIVGGAMVMIPAVMEIVEIKMPTSLV